MIHSAVAHQRGLFSQSSIGSHCFPVPHVAPVAHRANLSCHEHRSYTCPATNNPSSASTSSPTPGRRRRATTKSVSKPIPAKTSDNQPLSPVASNPAPGSKRAGSRPQSRATEAAAQPDVAAAVTPQTGPQQRSSSARQPRADAAVQTEATSAAAAAAAAAAARKPHRKPAPSHSQRQQQAEPPHIQYDLNVAVGSYSDLNRCSVNLDEQEHDVIQPNRNSSNPGSGNGNGSRSSSRLGSRMAFGSGSWSDGRSDDVHGLVYGATVRFSDSAALRLRRRAMVVWEEAGPQKVLIVKKPVPAAATVLRDMATWLQKRGLQVFVEASVHAAAEFRDLQPFDPGVTQVDFAITLGGDGTVLHLASLFAEDSPLPPVMCFAMGTLGFLTPFDAAQFRSCLARVLAANRKPLYCTLRTRKRCAVLDGAGELRRVHHILNECVVDRGAFPSSVYLELFIDGSFVTAAEADGLIIATPSGSTAYSMSAGGSMVAPSVPCTLVTPLSPHSLSFRPLIIPENADLMIRLPETARSHARASFDGKHPMRIPKGWSIHYQTSLCPLPLINIGSLDVDWYEGITRKLKWNQSIRGVPQINSGLEGAIMHTAAAAVASTLHVGELEPQLPGLLSDITAAAQNDAKVASWVEEALWEGASRK